MAQTSREIRRQIDGTRARIGTAIAEIERKVDPHRIIDEHPVALVGAAFGAGVLLSVTGAPARAGAEVRTRITDGRDSVNSATESMVQNLLDAVLGGVTATIAGRVNELLDSALGSSNDRKVKALPSVRAA
jgi:hypothetical protein